MAKACKKICHATELDALTHIRKLKEKNKGRKFAVYYCAFHNAYHVTHKTTGGKNFLKYVDK